ncbi:MAG: hypothetical protein KDD42_01815 [Bdellovibrionales bacterium]|nr:hypothetical protein [Bdellovibrionales bacterium]
MAKIEKVDAQQEDALEIIELACDDLDLLTRAFLVIEEVCQELQQPAIDLTDHPHKVVLN